MSRWNSWTMRWRRCLLCMRNRSQNGMIDSDGLLLALRRECLEADGFGSTLVKEGLACTYTLSLIHI